ncbi:MAG: hypothetical protein ACRDJN_01745 [Chloroflexota bacterium]
MSEAEFQGNVLKLARLGRWAAHFAYSSRRSPAGYPDLTLVAKPERLHLGPPYAVFAELKREGEYPRPEQRDWRRWLEAVEVASGGQLIYRLWRPSDMPEIRHLLTRGFAE